MPIKQKVNQLIKKYGTNNPFEIAEALGIVVRHVELGKVLGYHARHYRISVIHININSTEKQQIFTCAHELGHAIFHPDINTSFLKANTFYSTDRIEVEANTFAMELIFSQGVVEPITVQEAAEEYGIPQQLLKNFYP